MNTIISNNKENENRIETTINNFFKENKIGALLKKSNISKLQGASCLIIFKILFHLVFTGKSLNRALDDEKISLSFAKDVYYRFLQSTSYNWRKFLLLLSSSCIINRINLLSNESRENVLIIDDSLYDRSRSKCVEMLSNVHDHVSKGYKKGFRMLTLGWSDGNTFMPVAFSLLTSNKEKNLLCPMNQNIDKRTNGYKARKEAFQKSPDVTLKLIKQAKKFKVPAKYVLFDSWFTYPKLLISIFKESFYTIAMVKAMPNVFYTYNGKKYNLKTLYSKVKKKRGKAKILAEITVIIGHDDDNNEIPAKIIFVRNKHRKKDWLALISTDISIDAEEIVRIYGKRWDIEVFFKMTKSHLKLAKEFSCRSYDSLVAHTTIVFTRYIMLSLEKRKSEDIRTIGDLFYYCCDELDDITFITSLNLIIDILKNALREKIMLTKEQINNFLDYFIDCLPCYIKEKLAFSGCES